VYRNLQKLVRAGLISTLERSGAAVQFEINPDHHHHFMCRRCGQVWDVYLDQVAVTLDRQRSPLKDFGSIVATCSWHGLCARPRPSVVKADLRTPAVVSARQRCAAP